MPDKVKHDPGEYDDVHEEPSNRVVAKPIKGRFTKRPVGATTSSDAPEKVDEDARTRELDEEDEVVRIRQIRGGEVHWFAGKQHVREFR